ncbi:MAG TPA: hypothetical protein VGM75_00505, partial [Pseudonocardiaceae bacterium]
AQRAMAATEVNARWQADMSRYFTPLDGRPADDGRPPDESFLLLDEIFNLDDQLASLDSPHEPDRNAPDSSAPDTIGEDL